MIRVLVADDHACLREMISRTLVLRDCQVFEASNGREALAMLREHRPDVAILDVVMPGYDGLSVCRLARLDPFLGQLRIIVMSGNTAADEAIRAGADRFVSKPFRPLHLLDLIAELSDVRQEAT